MNYEKQTYLNTENLRDLYKKENAVTASVPAAKTTGGIRFHAEARAKVRLELSFLSLSGSYTAYFDGVPVGEKLAPYFSMEIEAERGTHVFDYVATGTNGGSVLRVTGAGVREDRRYYERVGGYYTSSQNVVYMRNGNRTVDKVIYANGDFTTSNLTNIVFDACLHYDKNNRYFTGSLYYINTTQVHGLYVNTGAGSTLTGITLTSAAIIDGYGLPTGHDCLFAYSDENGVLHLYTAVRSGAPTESSTTIGNVKRVVSSQRGSVLFVQNYENVWRAYHFNSSGDHSIIVGNDSIPYSVYDLERSGVYMPTGDLESGTVFAYYKKPNGIVVKRNLLQNSSVNVAYADAYLAGQGGGLLINDNDLTYKA